MATTETVKKSKRGGKREGAGRKPKNAAPKELKAPPVRKLTGTLAQPGTEPKAPTRGIMLMALGNPQYGRMAANCAASIRMGNKKVPIHLVYTPGAVAHLSHAHKNLFTSMSTCPDEAISKNGKPNYIKAKTWAYDLSPFDETLMVDVDLLIFARTNLTQLMEQLSKVCDVTMQCRGFFDYETGKGDGGKYTHWCDAKEAQKAYGLTGKLYKLSSELMFFKKCNAVAKVFETAKEVFDNPKLESSMKFAGDLPDELAFNLAFALCKQELPNGGRVFIYWPYLDGTNIAWGEVLNKYYGYSAGGNSINGTALTRYNQMAKGQATALGLPHHFNLFPKKQWDKQRAAL
jgi:hypothetical protein